MKKTNFKQIDEKKIKVLDHGFIRVIDLMGNDSDIVSSARVSYGDGTKSVNGDEGLIRYLMKHKHTSPFEMCEIKLHIKLPIFVARQWLRHRTANVNELSARYSVMNEDFYIPDLKRMNTKDLSNHQSSNEEQIIDNAELLNAKMEDHNDDCYAFYKLLNHNGLSRELSRTVLPVNKYTEIYWKIDLHNLLHFIELRIKENAQYEIRQYAENLLKIVKSWCPFVYQAFIDYRLEAITLSRFDVELLRKMLDQKKCFHFIEGMKKSERVTLLENFGMVGA